MTKLPKHKHEQLKANFDAFANDVEVLMSKHNLDGLRIHSIRFADDAGPLTPCVPPQRWRRICDLSGRCTWVCQ